MFLQRLREYGERLEKRPSMYMETSIRYLIELDAEGRQLGGIIDLATGKSGREKAGLRRLAPTIGKASAVRAKLLADTAEYVLGVARDPTKQGRVDKQHAAFRELIGRCAAVTEASAVRAVERCLDSLDLEMLADSLPSDFDAGGVTTFRVDGVFPFDLPEVRRFWAATAPLSGAAEGEAGGEVLGAASSMQCLVCGQIRPALKRLPLKVKGIPGGQTSGLALISANADAFLSYGLEASQIAPTCLECCELFTNGLNDLLAKPETCLRIGGVAYVFWTREPLGWSIATLFSDPQPQDVQALLNAARSGNRAAVGSGRDAFDDSPFYAAALSASGARLAVRDWLDTTVAEARVHLARYFRLQEAIGADGEAARPLKLAALCFATVREPKDAAPNTMRTLLRFALGGGRLPPWLLYQAVRRNQAEQGVTRPRAALIKMVITQDLADEEGDRLVELDLANRTPAYLCGRLLAVLESVQRAALPGINDSVTDRFFGSASSAPSTVFARLLQGARPHLTKLRRDRPGVHEALQRRLEEVLSGMENFPRTLTMEQQGLFALGYWHQQAADRAARTAGAAAKRERAGQQATDADQPDDE